MDYITRLKLANEAFGDNTELLGVIKGDEGERIVTRQPEVEALDPDNPHPANDKEVEAWLTSAGFKRANSPWQNWVREADGLELEDAHPGNFIKAKDGLRPIDVQLRQSDAMKGTPIIPWSKNPANPANRLR